MSALEIDMAEVREWARVGGTIAQHYFNNVSGERKKDQSWVTQADVEIEQLLRERIQARYPDHGIMGEEQGLHGIEREYVWSIDPLDGTDAFVGGLPIWAISIGLLRAGEPYLGVVYVPTTNDFYWTDTEGTAYRNATPITVTSATTFDQNDWIFVTSHAHLDYTIRFPCKSRSMGSFAVHLCYVARGSALGALIGYPQLWDIAAGLAILHAAGGVAVTLDGQPLDTRAMLDGSKPKKPLFTSTPALAGKLLSMIEQRPRRETC